MKNLRTNFMMLLCLLVNSLFTQPICSKSPMTVSMKDGWRFKQARLNNWYPATVPGVVHTDLLKNGLIEDPFYRLNERGLQWIDKEDWVYEKKVDVSQQLLDYQKVELHFDGLDTYADVYVNDSLVLKADNMFRRWMVDVKPYLHEGENTLRVYFHSVVKIDLPKWEALPFQYEASNDQSENGGLLDRRISIFARKAGYHYGWDWGPRMVTSGIWRPVYLHAWDDAKIEDVFFNQSVVNERMAKLVAEVTVVATQVAQKAWVSVEDRKTGKTLATTRVDLKLGTNQIKLPFVLSRPKLWWSNGLGEPYLYTFKTTVKFDKAMVDTKDTRVGIRNIKVVRKPDQWGRTFYFELNGKPVFAKGANYIPNDVFLPRVTDEKYRQVVADARDANMNMLRVWGGGIYENDIFYELCDEMGIMVWQDFMYACSMYPAEGILLENMRQEAIDNVKRLRNHACIALWCGNNECNDAWFGWGWKGKYEKQNPEYAKKIYDQYIQQFEVMLPKVVETYDPGKFYWPSSPYSVTGKKAQGNDGDLHYWSVWHGKVPIRAYNEVTARFFSEYGFQSFPEFISVTAYAPLPQDWNIHSEVMMAHQRGGAHANELIETYLLNEYKKPRDFKSFLYMNAVLQGDAIKTAIEAHRRLMPYNMGTLFWQHNDCWPVASWSSRDYYGRWKAVHYYAREAFKDILISPIDEQGKLKVFAVSDRLKPVKGSLKLEVKDFSGKIVKQIVKKITVGTQTSKIVFEAAVEGLLAGMRPSDVYVNVTFNAMDGATYTNHYFLLKQKEIAYPKVILNKMLTVAKGGVMLTLKADKFARGVYISLPDIASKLTDNYFDIEPGETKIVHIQTKLPMAELEKSLEVTCLNNEF